MTLTQILQKIKSAFYTKTETDSKLSTKANKSDLNDYLPKTGGAVFKGSILGRTVNNGTFRLDGGTSFGEGSSISLWGKDADYGNAAGTLSLYACDGSQGFNMKLFPNGSLTWGDKNIDVIEEQGDGYIRYSNGLQICWGYVSAGKKTSKTFPKSFSERPEVTITVDGANTDSIATATHTAQAVTVFNNLEYYGSSYMAIGRWK